MGYLKHLETQGLQKAAQDFNKGITEFDACVHSMNTITSGLLACWRGKGRTQFETQYMLMERKLEDISAILYEIYDGLVDAETTYIDADEAVAKEISASMSD